MTEEPGDKQLYKVLIPVLLLLKVQKLGKQETEDSSWTTSADLRPIHTLQKQRHFLFLVWDFL